MSVIEQSVIICYIVLIDVVDMWVYSRFFFLAVVVYLADFTCIVYGECICNQGVCDIDCVIYKFFCKVCDGRWNNRCPKIRGILIWLLAYDQYIFRFGKKYFFLEFWMHQIDMKIDFCIVWICPNMSKCVLLCVWKVNFFWYCLSHPNVCVYISIIR